MLPCFLPVQTPKQSMTLRRCPTHANGFPVAHFQLLYASQTIEQSALTRTDLGGALSLIRQQLQQLRLIAVVPQPVAACQQHIPCLHLHADICNYERRPRALLNEKNLHTSHL